MDAKPIIEAENLTKIYNGQPAVEDLNLTISAGEIFGFLGPNGAGKTTTLLMMLGLTEPSGGRIRVVGLDPVREPIKVKRQIGYLQENMGFYSDLDARQMLDYIAELNDIPAKVSHDRISEALHVVGLDQEEGKKIGAYSRGMRQRLGIAEILIKEPKIAFLDEPTLGLDPEATNRIMGLIEDICKEKKMTIILSSHLLQQVQRICTRIGIMIKGRMVACDRPEQLAREKLGIGEETYSLEALYMRYFMEDHP